MKPMELDELGGAELSEFSSHGSISLGCLIGLVGACAVVPCNAWLLCFP